MHVCGSRWIFLDETHQDQEAVLPLSSDCTAGRTLLVSTRIFAVEPARKVIFIFLQRRHQPRKQNFSRSCVFCA